MRHRGIDPRCHPPGNRRQSGCLGRPGAADQVAADLPLVSGVGDTAAGDKAVQRGHVVPGGAAPATEARAGASPPFDAGKHPSTQGRYHDTWWVVSCTVLTMEAPVPTGAQDRHKVLCAGKDKDVGLVVVLIARQTAFLLQGCFKTASRLLQDY